MQEYMVVSDMGARVWHADDEAHALEQHTDAFPDEGVITVVDIEPTCDVCDTTMEESEQWCGECGCCVEHCQNFTDCKVGAR